jgi:hypothetical protein
MGLLHSTSCTDSPTTRPLGRRRRCRPPPRGVAVQVAFESKGLKPVFHFTGARVETGRFQAMGQPHSSCTAPTAAAAVGPPKALQLRGVACGTS